MSLIDQAFGCCLNTLERIYVAVQLNVNFLHTPKKGETITAEGKVIHAGRSLGVAEMTVCNAEQKVIATATGITLSMGLRYPEGNPQQDRS